MSLGFASMSGVVQVALTRNYACRTDVDTARRSQKGPFAWDRITKLPDDFLPRLKVQAPSCLAAAAFPSGAQVRAGCLNRATSGLRGGR